jgi:hypothetical protein
MGVVNYEYYSNVYGGTDADEASFPALCARASDIVGAVTHWVEETALARFPELVQTLYKKAVCAQIDFFAINGTDSINESGNAGFTVGKVTVHGKATSATGGKLSESISPLAIGYLEQTGLMNPQVPTLEGWW